MVTAHIILHRILYFEYIYYEVIILDNLNIDKQTMDKLNSILNNGNLNDILSQIPPDTLQNFSTMINHNNTNTKTNPNFKNTDTKNNFDNETSNTDYNTSNSTSTSNNNFNFDFSKIDINTMMKIKTVMEQMNHNSNPRSNLLQSLKPYLRDEKKNKIDQYSNLLNMANLIELFNQNNDKENSSDQS